jgi:hypothetical protein
MPGLGKFGARLVEGPQRAADAAVGDEFQPGGKLGEQRLRGLFRLQEAGRCRPALRSGVPRRRAPVSGQDFGLPGQVVAGGRISGQGSAAAAFGRVEQPLEPGKAARGDGLLGHALGVSAAGSPVRSAVCALAPRPLGSGQNRMESARPFSSAGPRCRWATGHPGIIGGLEGRAQRCGVAGFRHRPGGRRRRETRHSRAGHGRATTHPVSAAAGEASASAGRPERGAMLRRIKGFQKGEERVAVSGFAWRRRCRAGPAPRRRARGSPRSGCGRGHRAGIRCGRKRFGQADAPKRRGLPFAAGGAAFGAVVGQPRAHVVQQKVGIGPDQLEALLGLAVQPVGDVFRRVAGLAAGGCRTAPCRAGPAGRRPRRSGTPRLRANRRSRGQGFWGRRPPARRGCRVPARAGASMQVGFALGAVAPGVGMQRGGQAHVARQRPRRIVP